MNYLPWILLCATPWAAELSAQSTPTWSRVATNGPTRQLATTAMVYEPSRAETIAYQEGFTWRFDGAQWQLASSTGPDESSGTALEHDLSRGRTVLFGGVRPGEILSDRTWEWDGSSWTEIATTTRPPARRGHQLAFDAFGGGLILFGGVGSDDGRPVFYGDTWRFDGTDWQRLDPVDSPTPRTAHGMTTALGIGGIILFGGDTEFGVQSAETWTWSGVNWRLLSPTASPGPRAEMAMSVDRQSRSVIAHGGAVQFFPIPGFVIVIDETWEFDGITWRELTTAGAPGRRSGHGLAYDEARDVLLLAGNRFTGVPPYDGNTWELRRRAPGTATASNFGISCGRRPPELSIPSGTAPILGSNLEVRIDDLASSRGRNLLALGYSSVNWNGQLLPFDLAAFGTIPRCFVWNSWDEIVPLPASSATLQIPIPADPSAVGAQLFLQALAFEDPSDIRSLSLSDSLALVAGN